MSKPVWICVSRQLALAASLVLTMASGTVYAVEEQPALFWLSIPATANEPVKSDAEVQFVSNGYFLRRENCTVIRSSGNVAADAQACRTVKFKVATKPATAIAPVWISEPVPDGYRPPNKSSKQPSITYQDYPNASLEKGEQGTVVLRMLVQTDGKVGSCEVVSTSGYERLDNAAKRGLCKRLKIKAATLDGVPVASINFTQVAFYAGK